MKKEKDWKKGIKKKGRKHVLGIEKDTHVNIVLFQILAKTCDLGELKLTNKQVVFAKIPLR